MEAIPDSQHGFAKDNSCLPSLGAVSAGVARSGHKGRAAAGIHPDIHKAFAAAAPRILLSKREVLPSDASLGRNHPRAAPLPKNIYWRTKGKLVSIRHHY